MNLDQEKRVLLAFALSFAILMLWRSLMVKPLPPAPKTVPVGSAPSQNARVASVPPAESSQARQAPMVLPMRQGEKAEELIVEGDLYRVVFSNEGALIKSWVLKKYQDEQGRPLDVVNAAACAQLGFPMSLKLGDPALQDRLNKAVYVGDLQPAKGSLAPPVKISLTYSDGTVEARKQFSFTEGYEVRVKASLRDGQGYRPLEIAWPGGFGDHSLPFKVREGIIQAVYGSPSEITKIAKRKVIEDQMMPGPFEFAGVEDRYFASIFLPDSPNAAFRISRQTWTPPDWTEKDPPSPLAAMLASPQPRSLEFRLFVAPKDLDVLRSTRPPLDSLVDFGWFSLVAKPLFLAMRYIYDHWVHNYGWAIMILTVLINLPDVSFEAQKHPLSPRNATHCPTGQGIQEKYKQYKLNDPRKQRMNEEMMKLYKEHGINPLGGCLPMVLQLPFLYGFYRVLDLSIELRHAPWILWVRDLSMPDRFHLWGFPLPILPTVMIITMFLLQRMTPMASTDPAQQRMMMVMPLVFGIMFYNFAAGLVLYWLTGNLVGIAQQMLINRMMPATQNAAVSGKTVGGKR